MRSVALSIVVLSSLVGLGACASAPPTPKTPKTVVTSGQVPIDAPEIKLTMPELAKSASTVDPRRAIADKTSFAALVAYMPDDSNAVMLTAKTTNAPVDKLLEPVRDVLPAELFSLATRVNTLPSSMRNVADDGADNALVLVRLEGTDASAKKSGVLFAPKGTKNLGKQGKRVSGLPTKENTIMNIESWTEVALDDAHIAMVPRDRVDGFAFAVTGRKTGQPLALKGIEPQITPALVAEAWVAPTAAGGIDAFGVAFADLRFEEATAGELTMHLVMTASLGDLDKMTKAVRDAAKKADGAAATDWHKAKITPGDNNTLTLDVTFAKPAR